MKKLALFICCFALCLPLSAQKPYSLSKLLPAAVLKPLEDTGSLQEETYKSFTLKLCPKSALDGDLSKLWQKDTPPGYTVETLSYIKKRNSKDTISRAAAALENFSKLSNSFYQTPDKKIQIYRDCYLLKTNDAAAREADGSVRFADGTAAFMFQDDVGLGAYISSLKVRTNGSELLLEIENLQPLKFSIIDGIKPHDMKTYISVIDIGEAFLFYSLITLDAIDIPGIKNRVFNGVRIRMETVCNWFKKEYLEG